MVLRILAWQVVIFGALGGVLLLASLPGGAGLGLIVSALVVGAILHALANIVDKLERIAAASESTAALLAARSTSPKPAMSSTIRSLSGSKT